LILKNILIIFLLIIIVSTFLFFTFKDYLLKVFIINYAEHNLNSECTVEKAHLSLKNIYIGNLKFSNKGADLYLKNVNIALDISRIFKPNVSGIILDGGILTIKNLEKIKNMFTTTKRTQNSAVFEIVLLSFDFKNILMTLKDSNNIELDIKFSLKGSIKNNNIILNDVEIYDANLPSDIFQISHLSCKKYKQDLYKINIFRTMIKTKEFKNVNFPVKIKTNKIVFPKTQNIFFGTDAYTNGVLDFNYQSICCSAGFKNVSFENMVSAIAGEDNATIKGLFDGTLSFCWQGGGLETLKGRFLNQTGGFVTIKKETSLDFLKSYLDEDSHKALVDNLKNYEYNMAEIILGKENDALSVKLDFNSETKGRRNITVNFHNGGGVK
jgi:hypothetical protein